MGLFTDDDEEYFETLKPAPVRPKTDFKSDAEYQAMLRERLTGLMDQQERGMYADAAISPRARASEGDLTRRLGMIDLINRSAAQAGSIGGKIADTSSVTDNTQRQIEGQQQDLKWMDRDRAARDNLNKYLMGKMLDQEGQVSAGALKREELAAEAKTAQEKSNYQKTKDEEDKKYKYAQLALEREKVAADIKKAEDALAKGKSPSDTAKAKVAFAELAERASQIAESMELDGYNPSSAGAAIRKGVPLIGDYVKTQADKQYDQAAEDFVTSVLRPDSGATITPAEIASAKRIYFPAPGDAADVILQKKEARARKIAALRAQGSQDVQEGLAQISPPTLPSKPKPGDGTATAGPKEKMTPEDVRMWRAAQKNPTSPYSKQIMEKLKNKEM